MNSLGPKPKLLTIITASNRPHNMRKFFENLKETVEDYSAIEVLTKIDIGDTAMQEVMEEAVNKYEFEIRYLQTPRLDGYYTLHYGYQQLFEMSNPETYFIFPVNEEVRFKTKGWDRVLAGYVKFFDDDFFRLKISRLKNRNYYSFHDSGPTPENYPFATRKWMELAGGIGDCWGPDGWHQYIDFHLGQTQGINSSPGIFRSIPINDILIGGEEAGKELTAQQIKIRSHRIFQEWWRMYRTEAQQEFRKIATRMLAYVWAKNEKITEFELIDDPHVTRFRVKDLNTGEFKKDFNYHLSAAYIRIENFRFLVKMARRNSIGFLTAFIYPSYGPTQGIKKHLNLIMRYSLVLIAVPLSFITADNESFPKKHYLRFALRMKGILRYIIKKILKIEPKEEVDADVSEIKYAKEICGSLVRKPVKIIYKCMLKAKNILLGIYRVVCRIAGKIRQKISRIKRQIIERIYYPNPLK